MRSDLPVTKKAHHSITVEGSTLTFSPLQKMRPLRATCAAAKQHERLLVQDAYRQALIAEFRRLGIPYGPKDDPLQRFSALVFSAVPNASSHEKSLLAKARRFCKKVHPALDEASIRDWVLGGRASECKRLLEQRGYKVSPWLFEAFMDGVVRASCGHKKPERRYYGFGKQVMQLAALLFDQSLSLQKKNRQVLTRLRACLRHPLYYLLKEEECHPIVHFLHGLALSSLTSPRLVEAFLPIAEQIGATVSQELQEGSFSEFLRRSRDAAYKSGLFKNDRTVRYALQHGKYLVGAFLSMPLGRLFSRIQQYDPRGHLENNPGAFFEQTFVVDSTSCVGRTIYTPSPTVGEEVAEETTAVLQALENRFFMAPRERAKEAFPYLCWVYVNLQNSTSPHEGRRSHALMKLQRQYPFSFACCTLAQDSPLYKGGIGGRDEGRIAQVIYGRNHAPLDGAYRELLYNEVAHRDNFHLPESILPPVRPYYFPVGCAEEREELQRSFREIVDAAYVVVREVHNGGYWYQKAAFRELVLLGIIAALQARTMKRCASCGDNVRFIFTQACKENVDRGGKTNAELFWAFGAAEERKVVLAALHGRALLSRARLIHPHRVEPMYAVTQLSQESVRAFLQGVFERRGASLIATRCV